MTEPNRTGDAATRVLTVTISSRGPNAAALRADLIERIRAMAIDEDGVNAAGVTTIREHAKDMLNVTVEYSGPDGEAVYRRLAREMEYLHLSAETVVRSGAGVEAVNGLPEEEE